MTTPSRPLFPIYQRQGRSWRKYKVGYIDVTGAMVIDPHFDDGLPFSEGLAAASIKGKWGFIDVSGSWIIAPTLDTGDYFSDGRAVVHRKKGATSTRPVSGWFLLSTISRETSAKDWPGWY